MTITRRHVQSSTPSSNASFEFPWWMGRLEDGDQLTCPYCRASTDDYLDPDLWDVPFTRFASLLNEQVSDPEWYGPRAGDLDLRLRGYIDDRKACLHICPMCGWWVAEDRAVLPAEGGQLWVATVASMSVLQELDLGDIEAPLEEVRRFLVRKYSARATMHPRLYELTVASIFRDLGYEAFATAYSNDGGIDVVLHDGGGACIGVQVKRLKHAVQVEQIGAFLGALTLGGYARGAFVTSSRFSKGAVRAAERSSELHVPIELIDADKFFDALSYAQLSNAPGPDDCGIAKSTPLMFKNHSLYYLNSL
jgi:restriction system protein